MIAGKQTEKEYRKLQLDSSSSLKEFSLDRRKYHKKYVLNERIEDDEMTKAAIIGSLVDCLLLEKDEFDNKFYMSSIAKAPTGNMLLFVESLVKYVGETETFEESARKAYKDSGYKWTFEKVLEKFSGSDAEIFFKECSEVKKKGLIVVTIDDVTNAERIVEELKNNEFIKDIINLVDSDRYTIFNQLQIDGFDLDGLPMKSMLDKVIVDHTLKKISIYDLKCIWAVENFYEEYYLYRRSYIQAYTYYWAIKWWKENHSIDNFNIEDYDVDIPRFIVVDSINYYSPLIYALYGRDIGEAYDGFEHKGKKYPGVRDIIADLKWAKENNNFKISRINYLNEGIVHIKQ